MNVSNDPRIIKQLLLSQWVNNVNPLASSSDEGDGNLFGIMLNGLMNGTLADDLLAVGQADLLPPGSVSGGISAGNRSFDDLISSAASRYGVDPALVKAVVQTESGFDPNAVSHAGAKGLMQLMDDTARGLGVNDSFDPAQNIDGGTRFLSYLLRKYDGQVMPALAAYNAGPGRLDRLGLTTDAQVSQRIGDLPQETQRYVHKVLTAMQQWSR